MSEKATTTLLAGTQAEPSRCSSLPEQEQQEELMRRETKREREEENNYRPEKHNKTRRERA